MTVSSSPAGEHAGVPGTHWERRLVTTETVVDDPEDTTVPGMNDPLPPQPNRATRRAAARAARRTR